MLFNHWAQPLLRGLALTCPQSLPLLGLRAASHSGPSKAINQDPVAACVWRVECRAGWVGGCPREAAVQAAPGLPLVSVLGPCALRLRGRGPPDTAEQAGLPSCPVGVWRLGPGGQGEAALCCPQQVPSSPASRTRGSGGQWPTRLPVSRLPRPVSTCLACPSLIAPYALHPFWDWGLPGAPCPPCSCSPGLHLAGALGSGQQGHRQAWPLGPLAPRSPGLLWWAWGGVPALGQAPGTWPCRAGTPAGRVWPPQPPGSASRGLSSPRVPPPRGLQRAADG